MKIQSNSAAIITEEMSRLQSRLSTPLFRLHPELAPIGPVFEWRRRCPMGVDRGADVRQEARAGFTGSSISIGSDELLRSQTRKVSSSLRDITLNEAKLNLHKMAFH